MIFNFNKRILTWGAGIVLSMIVLFNAVGINVAGYRTVIQYPNGTLSVKFDPGPYFQVFGSTAVYNDILTLDYDKTQSGAGATIDQDGIPVRYQDGGTGTVYGITRFRLPNDEKSMISIHKEFRSNNGLAYKLIKTITEETMNHTAGLMNSEESYTERGKFSRWAKSQLEQGKFQTVQKTIVQTEAGYEYCLEDNLTLENKASCKDVKKVTKIVPDIATKDGLQLHVDSDLTNYNITVSGFQMVDWNYEPATMKQISDKRSATMAIITSKANAERAKQDAITAEQQGLANVMTAKFKREVVKAEALVTAEQAKEVAVIAAKQMVDVAEQQQLEQKQLKLAAYETKQKEIALGQGEAERKRLVYQADGALQQKLDTYERVNAKYAEAIAQQKWVPEVQMGGSAVNGSAATDLISMLSVKAAKELALDMSMEVQK